MQSTGIIKKTGTRSAKIKGWSPPGATIVTDYEWTSMQTAGGFGGKDPNYRDKIARGENATNNYDATYYEPPGAGLSLQPQTTEPGDHLSFNGFMTPIDYHTAWDSMIANQVIGTASANALSRLRSGFSAGTFLGELRETLSMIRRPAGALRKLTDSYISKAQAYRYEWQRRGFSKRYYRDMAKALPDLYLEYKFGWKPLAQDIEQGYRAARAASKPGQRMRFNGTADTTVMIPQVDIGGYNNFPTSAYRFRVKKKVSVEYSARVVGAASLKLGFGMPAFQAGSTIPDFIPTAWNLLPWSFVIDYFSNVGDCLEARATASLVKIDWGCQTARAKFNCTNTVTWGSASGSIDLKAFTIQRRRIGGSLPLPSMQFDQRPSSGQKLNLAALAASKVADLAFKALVPPRHQWKP